MGNEEVRKRDGFKEPIPKRDTEGRLLFSDAKDFRPNMTPKEVLQDGSFGGTYFRPIKSAVTGLRYNKMWNELPRDWFEGELTTMNAKLADGKTVVDPKVAGRVTLLEK